MSANRYVPSVIIFSLLLLSIMGACASEKEIGVTVRDVGGVRERIYHDPTPPAVDPYLIEESTLFGTDQGGDTYLMTLPSPHALADDGTLYVIDARQTEAHRFAPDGTHLGKFGRKGQGPGEFFVLQDLTLDDERLYTNDPFNGRVTVMDLEGRLIEVVSFPDETPRTRFVIPYGFQEERGYILIEKNIRYPSVAGEVPQARFTILRLNSSLEIAATLLDSTGIFKIVMIGERPMRQPFENLIPATGIAPDMPIAWSYGHEFRIDLMDPDDMTRWAVTIPHEALPLSEELKESQLRSYERLTSSNEARRKVTFPDRLPHMNSIDDLRWDLSGRLWVQEYRDHTAAGSKYRFYVFSRDGKWLFQQDLPIRPWLITENGFYGRATDDEGNPLVQFHRFSRK